MGEWYCPACKAFISAETMTSAEVHDLCNTSVVWIEDVHGKEELYNAAPEMYEALKVLLRYVEWDYIVFERKYNSGNFPSPSLPMLGVALHLQKRAIERAKAVLSKAEGRGE